jgi:hypothetical protein
MLFVCSGESENLSFIRGSFLSILEPSEILYLIHKLCK